jgi:SAM-dependent methyltransferase
MSRTQRVPGTYDDVFFAYQREGSETSARAVLPHVVHALDVRSVLDVGCGVGSWLAVYPGLGIHDVCGVDGDYVNRALLRVEEHQFLAQDITRPFDLGRMFGLVQCLEVGEHVPTAASEQLVDNIVRHGRIVLFSAAVPGQGGMHHVNEQPLEFWRRLFHERGYEAFDFVRPCVQHYYVIAPWYRYNMLCYVHREVIDALPGAVRLHQVPAHDRLADYSPVWYRLRKAALRALPVRAVSMLAAVKHRVLLTSRLLRSRLGVGQVGAAHGDAKNPPLQPGA